MEQLQFVDAQEMSKKHPDTFEAPSIEELNDLAPDVNVKVCVEGERFWVLITEVNGDKITGTVDNDLQRTHVHGLSLGDTINFEKKHVYGIY